MAIYCKLSDESCGLDSSLLLLLLYYVASISLLLLFDLTLFTPFTANALPQFFLGGNPFFCDCEMEWLQKINQMAHRGTHPQVMDLDNVKCRLNNKVDANLQVPIMQVRNEEFLCPYQAHCFALCMCCDFFACDCRMQCPEGCSCFHDSTWSANVIQCSRRNHYYVPHLIPMDATAIHLDGNHFNGTLESQAFIGRKRVTSLFLNNSMIGAISNQTFNGLTELEVLHLEDNLIHSLQGYEFGNLTSLRELYLQRNKLAYIDANTFSSLVSLEMLYLHDNLLTLQPIWELTELPLLRRVTLSGNPWSCQCDFVSHFVTYASSPSNQGLITDMSSITCHPTAKDEPLRNFLTDTNATCTDAMAITYSNQTWNHVLPITVASIAICIVIVVASVILFVFRTPLRVWLHSKYGVRVCTSCVTGASKGSKAGHTRDKLYDAFVSYSLKDEEFVHQVLVGQLEQSEDPGYKLCLQHRDLPHNSSIADTYPSVSTLCAKQILVASLAFLETEWPKIKYSIQDLRKYKPLVLLIEDLSSLDLAKSPEFNLLLKTAVVIKWSETGFWNKLKYYLPDAVHFTYRRNININNASRGLGTLSAVPSTPKLTDRLTSGSPAPINMQQLFHAHPSTNQTPERTSKRPMRGQQGMHVQTSQPWSYEGAMIHSNNSSTSTRSTVTNGGSPRTLSSTEDSSQAAHLPVSAAMTSAHVVTNPLDQLGSSLADGLEQWSDRSDSAYSWHDHTYQTITTSSREPIYHTLDPGGEGTIPVMLPNGRMVPATLVRNSSGRIVPLVQVGGGPTSATTTTTSSASSTNPPTFATSSRTPATTSQTVTSSSSPAHHQVTFPNKSIVYKSPSRSGYLV